MPDIPTLAPERTILEKLFLSPDERRLRAGWRLFLHTIVFLLLVICAEITLLLPLSTLGNSLEIGTVLFLFNELGIFFGVTIATFLSRHFIDRRSIVSLGLKLNTQALYDLLAGIAITFFIMGLIYLIEFALGWTEFEGFSWQAESGTAIIEGLLLWLVIFVITGWSEELLSRGYHLQNIADGLNVHWGVIISSSVFALLHLGNPSASWISTLGILLAGLFLALPYVLTRQLWLSIGLHIGWNFFEGVVFGFPVSGLQTFHLLRHTVSGPELWTGGAFGPEAGLLVIPALLLGALLVYGYTRPEIRGAMSEKPVST